MILKTKYKRISLIVFSTLLFVCLLFLIINYLSFDPTTLLYTSDDISIIDKNNIRFSVITSNPYYEYVTVEEIPSYCKEALIATEDKTFYSNIGIDIAGLARATVSEFTGVSRGGSTITQQLVKLNSEDPFRTNPIIKLQEAVYALKTSQILEKEIVLESYLNSVNYGNDIIGIENAAKIYFHKTTSNLNVSECAYLIGVINKPALYNPYFDLEAGIERKNLVLELMFNNNYISAEDLDVYINSDLVFFDLNYNVTTPHAVQNIKKEFNDIVSAQKINISDVKEIKTAYNYSAHKHILDFAQKQIAQLKQRGANNSGVIVINNTGGVEVLIGTVDYFSADGGNVNHAESLIQVGSTMKPLFYSLAFFEGYLPSSVILDEPVEFYAIEGLNGFTPRNADNEFHGLQTIRTALGNSYNIPVMILTDRIGADKFINLVESFGFKDVDQMEKCGIVISVGACEITLFDLVRAYSAFQNKGEIYKTYYINEIIDKNGDVLWKRNTYEVEYNLYANFGDKTQAITQMITNILSDNDSRRTEFGSLSNLRTTFPTAVKTGTTQNHKDALTVGYSTENVVGVWVGNSKGLYMDGLYGSDAAAPIWQFAINEISTLSAKPFDYSKLGNISTCNDLIGSNDVPLNFPLYEKNLGFIDTINCQQIIQDVIPIYN